MSEFDPRDQAAYDALQAKLVPLWKSIDHINKDPQTIVVAPSIEVDVELSPSLHQAYEERFLFLLFLLRQPRARMIFLTGQAIHSDIVDYYFDLMPGVISSHARRRLHLISPMEATDRPLARKILDRPRLVERIRSLIPDPDRAHLVPFMNTWSDRELAMRLGIPMYGTDPRDAHLGTKTAGREVFARAGIPHPRGRAGLQSRNEVVTAIADLVAATPGLESVVIKHNEGVSGFGNAIVDVTGLPADDPADDPADEIDRRLDQIPIALPGLTPDEYFRTLEHEGGVVEEMLGGDEIRSPSVQLRVTPLGQVELLSTHDQVLGGESGQVFMGSRFPADRGYAAGISADAARVGELLAAQGVIGRFALDFVVVRRGSEWDRYAIEINLRKGGTTHPFLTLQFLTDGSYDPATGVFTAPSGTPKFYVASDHLEGPDLHRLLPRDVLDIAVMNDLHFDQARQTGSVFHMLSALPVHGRLGVTSVGDSPHQAQDNYDRVVDVFGSEIQPGTLDS